MFGSVRNLWQWLLRRTGQDRDAAYMRQLRGVIHVGANTGQERAHYNQYGLRVLWIEPVPEVFAQLQANLDGMAGQSALCALIADQEGREVDFHVASNDGLSSSMLELGRHKEVWPEVKYQRTLKLRTTTLDAMLRDGIIAPVDAFNGLVMDTQGSELMVLRGATELLRRIDFVKTEAADFESYVGCCQLDELGAFLGKHGFAEMRRHRFANRPGLGAYYDVVFQRHRSAAAQAHSPTVA
jgi:FkbM family methyltransferase